MNHHTVTLAAFCADGALAVLAAVQLVAEVRWRRACGRREPPAFEERRATSWTEAPALQPHGDPTTTGGP